MKPQFAFLRLLLLLVSVELTFYNAESISHIKFQILVYADMVQFLLSASSKRASPKWLLRCHKRWRSKGITGINFLGITGINFLAPCSEKWVWKWSTRVCEVTQQCLHGLVKLEANLLVCTTLFSSQHNSYHHHRCCCLLSTDILHV